VAGGAARAAGEDGADDSFHAGVVERRRVSPKAR
jgi:hypothetical protein